MANEAEAETRGVQRVGFLRVLAATERRLRLVGLGQRLRRAALLAAATLLALLLLERLLGLGLPLGWLGLGLLAALAVGAVLLLPHRDPGAAARALDRHAGTRDLFLTRSLLPADVTPDVTAGATTDVTTDVITAAGGYEPLVVERAEAAAATTDPRAAVPLRWRRPLAEVAGAAALLAIAWLALPRLHLLHGRVDQQQVAQREHALDAEARQAERKIAALREREVGKPLQPKTAQAVQQLQNELRQMRPDQQQQNRKQLQVQQKALGSEWRQAKAATADNGAQSQSLGRRSEQSRALEQQMRAGDGRAMQSRLAALQQLSKGLAEAEPERREELRRRLQQELHELQDAAAALGQSGSELRSSLAQALQQLASTTSPELAQKALAALDRSLELSQLEAQALAQSLRDLQALEQALETARLAKMANELAPLDGEACASCDALADYQELYQQMLAAAAAAGQCEACEGKGGECGACGGSGQKPCAGCGGSGKGAGGGACGTCNGTGRANGWMLGLAQGIGGGMGGPGQGKGGIAPEDDSQQTTFTPEKVPSQLTAGRMLMRLRTTGEAEKGEAKQQIDEALQAVQQEAAEAVLRQDVPPGYHAAIKSYFEGMQGR